ncbi:MAG TPA: dolichyl-phosphate beta-glucosyltransferase [Planctomycetota bacterium]|jgi:dolichyl-phosphate beta-glucosyltransferase
MTETDNEPLATDPRPLPGYASFDRPAATTVPVASIVIPAFNEARRIEPYLKQIAAFFEAKAQPYEILVVNDGSRDNTAEFVRSLLPRFPALGLISYDENRGKGHAVRLGMLTARGSLRAFADADGATPIGEWEKLRAQIDQGAALAIGSRAIRDHGSVSMSLLRKFIAQGFRLVRRMVLPLDIKDTQCGFKLFTAAAAESIFRQARLDGLAFDVELLYLAACMSLKVAEVPIEWHEAGESHISLLRDPLRMFVDLLRVRRLHADITNSEFRTQNSE